jgi:YHS domain
LLGCLQLINQGLFVKTFFLPGTLIGLALITPALRADDEDEDSSPKGALQALNDFIGEWKGVGGPDTRSPDRQDTWEEQLSWSWRFKGDDVALVMAAKNGKYLKRAELRYLPDQKRYQLTVLDKNDRKLVFVGENKNGYLTLERTDPQSRETQRLIMNSAGEGVRFIYRFAHRPADRTLFTKDYQVACTKEGESLAAAEKKVECPVSGGLGKIPVSYNGMTYYVCCSGCRDAFNENPEKFVKEYEARKKKK